MKHILYILLLGLAATAANSRPNFVFFLVDDLGWGDLGCYGATFHETPNLDRLASQGMRFTNAYSACTVCSPSRAAILTGRYPGRLHLTDWIKGHGRSNPKMLIPQWNMRMDHELITLPEALKDGGYRSQFVGKWHLMPIGAPDFEEHYPEHHGFHHNLAGREWGQPKGPGKYFSPFGMPNLDDGKKGDFLTDRLTDGAIDFIQSAKDEPFLLYFSYYTVHGPIMAKPALLEKYKKKAASFENTRNERVHPAYAGMIESLDESVGRVMAALDSAGVSDNTVVIFTADNGGTSQQSSGGLRGAKALSYEGGTREPALVKWPGKIAPGSTSDAPIIGTDFYPTLLAMADLPQRPKDHADGRNLLPLLTGQSESLDRDALFWHYPHYHRTPPYGAIRKDNFKLIEFFEDGRLELYDLAADSAESTNLLESQPERAQQLLADLRAWRQSVDAQMPTPNPNYAPKLAGKRPKPRGKPSAPAPTTLGKISASSSQTGNPPEAAVDGSQSTRWAADGGSVPQWWQIEFPEPKALNGTRIHWRNHTWFSYTLSHSMDGKNWKVAVDQSGSRELRKLSDHNFEAKARFLRVTVDALGSGWVSFTELQPQFVEPQ
jgi:arylsulfatase A-like enzyme